MQISGGLGMACSCYCDGSCSGRRCPLQVQSCKLVRAAHALAGGGAFPSSSLLQGIRASKPNHSGAHSVSQTVRDRFILCSLCSSCTGSKPTVVSTWQQVEQHKSKWRAIGAAPRKATKLHVSNQIMHHVLLLGTSLALEASGKSRVRHAQQHAQLAIAQVMMTRHKCPHHAPAGTCRRLPDLLGDCGDFLLGSWCVGRGHGVTVPASRQRRRLAHAPSMA